MDIDSTMGRIHVCLLCCLLVTIRGLVGSFTFDTTSEKGAADKNKATAKRNLAQGRESDEVSTVTTYFDPVWNAFSKLTDG